MIKDNMKIKIFDYGMNGEGVGKIDGKICLVPYALVDEVVDCDYSKDHENYTEAKLINIEQSSIMRIIPLCPYFYECGGCSLQHMKYSEQLSFKKLLVQKTIKKICDIECLVNKCIPCSKKFNYRNKMSFRVKNDIVGFNKANTNCIIDIATCPLADDEINKIFKVCSLWLKGNKLKEVKNIVIRHLNNQTLIGVVVTSRIDLTRLIDSLKDEFKNFGVYEIVNSRKDSVVLSGKVFHIYGINSIEIVDYGLTYSVDLLGFHQTNTEVQNKIYDHVLNLISDNDVVLNGFSGQGLLSAVISKKSKQVIGIEINASSHKSAQNLKAENQINNLTNIHGDFFKEFKKYKEKISTVIIDPAKKGCGKLAMQEICGVENIIYISCNPIALAKDLNVIKDYYLIENITPFDMFPQTNSVETVVKLKLKEKNL